MSKGSRVLQGSALTSLALLLLAQVAAAQTAPKPKTPAAQPRAGAPTAPADTSATKSPAAAPSANPAPPGSVAGGAADTGVTSQWSLPDDDGGVAKSQTELEIERRFGVLRAGQGITADDVARRTVHYSPSLEAKRRAVDTAQAGVDQAKAGYWPSLKLSAGYSRLSPISISFPLPGFKPFTYPVNSYAFDAALTVPISDYVLKNSHTVASASHSREAAAADQLAQNASVVRDGRVNYYTWIGAQAQELVALQALEQARGHQRDAENGFQAGLNSKADLLRTQADVTTAELAVERAQNTTELARLAMQVGMGDPSGQKYDPGEDVFSEPLELTRLPTADAAYQEALTKRAELKSLIATERATRDQAQATRVANYPRLDGQAGANIDNPNQRYVIPDNKFHTTWQAGLILSWIPTQIPGTEAAANVQDSKAAELIAQQRDLKDSLKLEIENARKSAEIAHLAIQADTSALASAREAYRVRRELFRAGRATLVEVTDAATDLNRTRFRLADDYVQARVALAELHHALGRDTDIASEGRQSPH
jgi:outer membrane protein TolC